MSTFNVPPRRRRDRFLSGIYLFTHRSGNLYVVRLTALQAAALKILVVRRFRPPCSLEVIEADDRTVRNLRNLVVNSILDDILNLTN